MKITVSGLPREGKTTICQLIKKALQEVSIPCNISTPEDTKIPTFGGDLYEEWLELYLQKFREKRKDPIELVMETIMDGITYNKEVEREVQPNTKQERYFNKLNERIDRLEKLVVALCDSPRPGKHQSYGLGLSLANSNLLSNLREEVNFTKAPNDT